MADLFISYAREDEPRIRPLVAAFEARGWSVFWDRRIPAGETWRSYIGTALQAARCIVVAWSEHSVQSQWVAEEADEGRVRGILVPVLLDAVLPPRGFREIQAADLSGRQPGEASARLDELLGDVARRLGGPAAPGGPGAPLAAARSVPPTPHAQAAPSVPPAPPPAAEPRPAHELRAAASAKVASSPLRWLAVVAVAVALSGLGWWGWRSAGVERRVERVERVDPAVPRTRERPAPEGEATWCVVAGSFPRHDLQAAERRHLQAMRADLPARLIDSHDAPLFAPDLVVVCVGPFPSRDAAEEVLPRVRGFVPDAYVKRAR